MNPHILVVDDEPEIRQLLGYLLKKEGYSFDEVADTREAERKIESKLPDLILLDWMLPGVSGIDWLKRLQRQQQHTTPVIFLTARTTETDKVAGLQSGDDYITKPFSNKELLARIKAVLRRSRGDKSEESTNTVIRFGDITLDCYAHQATANGDDLGLNRKEFQLLSFFAAHPGRAYSRQKILDYVWGTDCYAGDRTVDVHVRRLRRRLAEKGLDNPIKTIWGVGYMAAATK